MEVSFKGRKRIKQKNGKRKRKRKAMRKGGEGGMGNEEEVEPVFVNVKGAQESIPPVYVAWRPGTITLLVVSSRQVTCWRNQCLGIDSLAPRVS